MPLGMEHHIGFIVDSIDQGGDDCVEKSGITTDGDHGLLIVKCFQLTKTRGQTGA